MHDVTDAIPMTEADFRCDWATTKRWKCRLASDLCVELLSSRLSIDGLMLNTYSASGRRTVHLATTSPTQHVHTH